MIEGGRVRIRRGIHRGANRRLAGEDVRQGQAVLRAGRRLGPPEVGLAGSPGCTCLPMRRLLRVALLSTGDGVAEPGTALSRGQIYDSNRFLIASLLRHASVAVTDGGILPDNAGCIRAALETAADAHDVILTSGGVSTGDEDHVRDAIRYLGSLSFWRLGIKPGRPVAVGVVRGKPLVGLPGKPVAVMVSYMAIARPLLAALGGDTPRPAIAVLAVSDFAYRSKRDRREYVRVRLIPTETGLRASRFPRDRAGILTSLTDSDALVELPDDLTHLELGAVVRCLPLAALYG